MSDLSEPAKIIRWEFDVLVPEGTVEARVFSDDDKVTRLQFSKATLDKLINALLGVQRRISN